MSGESRELQRIFVFKGEHWVSKNQIIHFQNKSVLNESRIPFFLETEFQVKFNR